MKYLFAALLLLTLTADAQVEEKRLRLTPFFVTDRSSLNFSIAGNEQGTSPNIYSELRWEMYGKLDMGWLSV
ncbi:hypothetical protein OQZ33_05365 [Pedobacter sp. MC2016-05]|uniref:hypothetical protein n=1 Tax=Pedobacter sp. MC2016-05 TaxID=2994474 RepID=UPI002246AA38|nr:hypothetical protein [Pedobacter sp. MC2016-05]MCX2473751.1 hypothetical protein [Pedobacter sp. MC2016-05]